MMSIHLLIPYPDISDLLTRGEYMSANVQQAGLPIRDVRLATRSIKNGRLRIVIETVLYEYL
jgi:hypothetical protein